MRNTLHRFCHVSRWLAWGILHLSKPVWWWSEFGGIERKEIKKKRKEEKKKEENGGGAYASTGRVLLLLGIPLSKGHSMAIGLNPNSRAGARQFGTNCGTFMGTF